MNVLLIDDEPKAISSLRRLLNDRFPDLNILATANSAHEALPLIESLSPDLIFLDVEMPGGSGFDLLRHLPRERRPAVIFVTSRTEYALQAIRVAAVSYLVKPVNSKELAEALQTARERIRDRQSRDQLEALLRNMDTQNAQEKLIGLPSEAGVEYVSVGDILYCRGYDGYTKIHLTDGSYRLSSYSIGGFRKTLVDFNFFPVHRSYLVNHTHVKGYRSTTSLELSSGDEVPVSRRKKPKVDDWLGKRISAF